MTALLLVWLCADRLDCDLRPSGDRAGTTLGVSWVTNGAPNRLRIAGHECVDYNGGVNRRIAGTFPSCLFTPLVERQMILVDHQRSIRQICRSPYIEAAISLSLCRNDRRQSGPLPLFELRL